MIPVSPGEVPPTDTAHRDARPSYAHLTQLLRSRGYTVDEDLIGDYRPEASPSCTGRRSHGWAESTHRSREYSWASGNLAAVAVDAGPHQT